jgi:hypothetical protein
MTMVDSSAAEVEDAEAGSLPVLAGGGAARADLVLPEDVVAELAGRRR